MKSDSVIIVAPVTGTAHSENGDYQFKRTGAQCAEEGQKKARQKAGLNPHHCRVQLDPLNKYCYLWDLPDGLQLSGAMPTCWPPSATHPVIVFNYGSRTVANHVQSRENCFSKDQLQLHRKSSAARIISSENLKIIFDFRRQTLALAPFCAVISLLRASINNLRPLSELPAAGKNPTRLAAWNSANLAV